MVTVATEKNRTGAGIEWQDRKVIPVCFTRLTVDTEGLCVEVPCRQRCSWRAEGYLRIPGDRWSQGVLRKRQSSGGSGVTGGEGQCSCGASAHLLSWLRGWGEMTFDMHFALKEQNALTSEDCCRNAERFSSMKLIKDIHHLVKYK